MYNQIAKTCRIINDLKLSNQQFSNVEIKENKSNRSIKINSLVLAALSPCLSKALKDLVYENVDENIKIILSGEDLNFSAVESFFENVLFSDEETLELDTNYSEVFTLFGIRLLPEVPSIIEPQITTKVISIEKTRFQIIYFKMKLKLF